MARAVPAALLPMLAVALPALWLLAPPGALPARFGADDCRRVTLVDAETGAAISGAEDLALSAAGDTLIFSAYDRLDPARPDGGLYAISAFALGAGGPAEARPLVEPGGLSRSFRPHGLALSPDGRRLAVVNRSAPHSAEIDIGVLDDAGWRPERRIRDDRLCRANDLAFTPEGGLVVSLDRADCDTSARDLWGGTGRIARIDGRGMAIQRAGLSFPNGIAAGWIAETRGQRLLGPEGAAIVLPGGPDNLTPAGAALVVAVHPSLARTGLWLNGWLDRAPSRILRVEPESGAVEVLFDDPEGTRFSGATVGVLVGDRLVAGSARDAGLLVCGPA